MNIQDARQELIYTIQAYTSKNEDGTYRIPVLRQRPMLLIGPPGIGKTAIMEQAAAACGIGFVAYTMTHHTRQSAIGLPYIEHHDYNGQDYAVTEYTMSEIIASVYRCMEETGCREGLLFLDEINCVSETLAPAMLQFLQNKMFGNHRLPDGWVLAAAGNPPEYNKSVREFDIATLDRLKYITIEADYPAWRSYALEMNVHGAILSYLDARPEQFYLMKQSYASKQFVTARGWEDLSCLLLEYENLKLPVTKALIAQYLHSEELAQDFSGFYYLYAQRQKALPVAAMLAGSDEAFCCCREWLLQASFAEQLYLIQMILSHLGTQLTCWEKTAADQKLFASVFDRLKRFQEQQKFSSFAEAVPAFLEKEQSVLRVRREHGLSTERELRQMQQTLYLIQTLAYQVRADGIDPLLFAEQLKTKTETCAIAVVDQIHQSIRFLADVQPAVRSFFLAALQQNRLADRFICQYLPELKTEITSQLDFVSREAQLKQGAGII